MNILSSSITGNILGVLSLILGIISTGIAFYTLKTAKNIEEEIKKRQIKAINKSKFVKAKPVYINKLKQKRNAVLKLNIISGQICIQVLSVLNDIIAQDILNQQDRNTLENDMSILKKILADNKKCEVNSNSINDFDKVIADTIGILEKGEYEL